MYLWCIRYCLSSLSLSFSRRTLSNLNTRLLEEIGIHPIPVLPSVPTSFYNIWKESSTQTLVLWWSAYLWTQEVTSFAFPYFWTSSAWIPSQVHHGKRIWDFWSRVLRFGRIMMKKNGYRPLFNEGKLRLFFWRVLDLFCKEFLTFQNSVSFFAAFSTILVDRSCKFGWHPPEIGQPKFQRFEWIGRLEFEETLILWNSWMRLIRLGFFIVRKREESKR